MVIANIIGGLGNQMFQYAVGRALSLQYDEPLLLDVTDFENYELHQGFELQRLFTPYAAIAVKSDIYDLLGWQCSPSIRRVFSWRGMTFLRRKELIVEPYFQYWAGINETPKNCYLYGYWQSEKYFIAVESQIRKDFTFPHTMEKNNIEVASQIKQVNAVSLHIRRGDYANNPNTTATHGLCSLDYYQKAIEYIAERIQQPHFYIFSDDIAWVKSNLKLEYRHQYIDHNHGSESYNDMRLMSLCQHHIIANSSFSWWGAWLNSSPEKIVVSPKCWFADEMVNVEDLLPDEWIRL
jgi:hypothetical protein